MLPAMSDPRNLSTIERYFSAFASRDGKAMSDCYAPDARFRDPVFELRGAEIGAMWQMLCSRATDLRIESSNLRAGESDGSADWQAWYTFSTTGRAVHNVVSSRFRLAQGRIVEQTDHFPFWRWSRQALGMPGLLLGWTPLIRNKVRQTARASLAHYMKSGQSKYQG